MKPFQWFLTGQLEMRRVKLLGTKGITYVEQIAIVLISKMVLLLGTVASARKVTMGTHTSKMVAKVYIQFTYQQQVFFNFLFIFYFFKVYIFHEFLKYCLILVTQKMLHFFY